MRTFFLLAFFTGFATLLDAQAPVTITGETNYPKANMVNFDDYMKLATEVQEYRKNRLVSYAQFRKMALEPNTLILDTRSDSMYMAKHLKGAVHLNFSDFTVENLQKVIPARTTRILIYCNNNFTDEPIYFASKAMRPDIRLSQLSDQELTLDTVTADPSTASDGSKEPTVSPRPDITLALNIPTFINLCGYGYMNVYELGEEIRVVAGLNDELFSGTAVAPR